MIGRRQSTAIIKEITLELVESISLKRIPLNCGNCFNKGNCQESIDDPYAEILGCAIRRCCEVDLPYACLPQPVHECDCLHALGLEGHAPGYTWGFLEDDFFADDDPLIEDGLVCISLETFAYRFANQLLGITREVPDYPTGYEPVSIGDRFALVANTQDNRICPLAGDCDAECSGYKIPYDDKCLLVGRHPLLIPIKGDDIAVQVTWAPEGPFFDQIDLRELVA